MIRFIRSRVKFLGKRTGEILRVESGIHQNSPQKKYSVLQRNQRCSNKVGYQKERLMAATLWKVISKFWRQEIRSC
jgi:hypothetical protein